MNSNSTQGVRRPDLDTGNVSEATDATSDINVPGPQRPTETASSPAPLFWPPVIENLPSRPASSRGIHFGSPSEASIASAPSEASLSVPVLASAFSVASAPTSAERARRTPAYGAPRPRSQAENAINRRNIRTRAAELQLIGQINGRRIGYVGNAILAVGVAGFVATIAVPIAVPSQRIDANSSTDILRVFGMGLGSVAVFSLGMYVHHIAFRVDVLPYLREDLAARTHRMADVEIGVVS